MTEPASQPSPSPSPAPAPQPWSSPAPAQAPLGRRAIALGVVALVALAAMAVGLIAVVAIGGRGTAGASPTRDPKSFAYAQVKPAPRLVLTDQDGNPFTMATVAGRPALVFFGYTHCPDVCPTTVGNLNQVLAEAGAGPRVVFVSIDPERDDVAAMHTYMKYLPTAYYGLSGTPSDVNRDATGWGVQYARTDQHADGSYAMAHTADVFLVDAQGMLRAHFPFGTQPPPITEAVKALLAETPAPTDPPATPTLAPGVTTTPGVASPAPTDPPAPTTRPSTAAPAADLRVTVVSTSIWAGPTTPVILNIGDANGQPLDGTVPMSVRIIGANETAAGPDVTATAILPMGERMVSYVAYVSIPVPGPWRLDVIGADGSRGSAPITALDQGATATVGALAPDVDTPTLPDVGGNIKLLTTVVDAQVDERLYITSIADARAAGRPYVLVIDSNRFRVSPACGRAITMIRYLLDRWPGVTFTHVEPFDYQVITNEPVLSGSLTDPPLNRWTEPFGMGDATWPATSMPWIFVVDGQGVIRAKYTGIIGSADVDLILSLVTGNGVLGG